MKNRESIPAGQKAEKTLSFQLLSLQESEGRTGREPFPAGQKAEKTLSFQLLSLQESEGRTGREPFPAGQKAEIKDCFMARKFKLYQLTV